MLDANANAGAADIDFNIPTSDSGYSGQWWTISLNSALPTLTDNGTRIRGFTQTSNVGDNNPGVVGTGGTVGVDAVALPQYDRPEIAIDVNGNSSRNGITIGGNASNIHVEGLTIYDARKGVRADSGTGTNRTIDRMLIGTLPDGTNPGSERITADGVEIGSGGQLSLTRSYIGWNGQCGVDGSLSGSTATVEYCEVFANGWDSANHDGIDINGVNNIVRYNLAWNNTSTDVNSSSGCGIEVGSTLAGAGANNLVENNTSRDNLIGVCIRKGASDVTLSRNLILVNDGPGVLVSDEGRDPTSANRITQNSIYDNGGLGIDLSNDTTNQGDGVTPNDDTMATDLPNNGIDFPIITDAGLNLDLDTLYLRGYIGDGAGSSTFADAVVEIFIAALDPTGYGEGKTYLGFLTANAGGNFSGTLSIAGTGLADFDYLTATAWLSVPGTSEFGPSYQLPEPRSLLFLSLSAMCFLALFRNRELTGTVS